MRNEARKPAHRAEDKGFYIILILCLTVIGISGYVLFFSPAQPEDRLAAQQVQTDVPRDTGFQAVDERYDVPLTPEAPEPEPKPRPAAAEPKVQTAAPAAPKAPVWVRPMAGEVLKPWSGGTLVYQETFGDWRVHPGVDYVGGAGTRVYAVGDGRVKAVTTDALWGTCLTLSLPHDREAVYRGLSERVKVKAGDTVRAGDLIATVGEHIPAEEADGAHLHFELREGGKPIDPEALFTSGKPAGARKTAAPQGIDAEE